MSFTETQRDCQHKGFDQPDEVREFPNGRAEILEIGGGSVGRFVFQPGWRWSTDVKLLAGTHSCEIQHFQHQVSGRMGVRMERRHRVRHRPRGSCCRSPAAMTTLSEATRWCDASSTAERVPEGVEQSRSRRDSMYAVGERARDAVLRVRRDELAHRMRRGRRHTVPLRISSVPMPASANTPMNRPHPSVRSEVDHPGPEGVSVRCRAEPRSEAAVRCPPVTGPAERAADLARAERVAHRLPVAAEPCRGPVRVHDRAARLGLLALVDPVALTSLGAAEASRRPSKRPSIPR